MTHMSLGVSFDGNGFQLSLLSRRLNRIRIKDLLAVTEIAEKTPAELKKQVSGFLRKNKVENYRCVLSIPRQETILRQIDLPREAESNLAKVVEYQVASLLPSEEVSVCYDYWFPRPEKQAKTLQVTIFLVPHIVLEKYLQICEGIGLKVDLVAPSSALVASYFLTLQSEFKISNALVVHLDNSRCELVGLSNKRLCLSREFKVSENERIQDFLPGEVDQFRGQIHLPEDTILDIFIIGDADIEDNNLRQDKRLKIRTLTQPISFHLVAGEFASEGRKIQAHFASWVAAFSGLKSNPPIKVNLLPAEKRVRRSNFILIPTYVLIGVNLILGLMMLLNKPVQERYFSQQLSREISRLEPEVKKIRSVEQEVANLQRRIDLLSDFRRSNKLVLEALNELSKILPHDTFIFDLNLKNSEVEISGNSQSSTSLPQILDNSSYFQDAEFIAPITKDGSGREIYRLRVRLRANQPPRSVSNAKNGRHF